MEQIADIQVKEPFWDTAVRLVDQNPPMYSGVYETGYNKRKREWKRVRSRKIGKWFATAFLYIVIFCLVEQMMGTIEESFLATTVNIKLNGIVTSSEEGDVFWLTLDEMKQRKLAYGMDKMLEVFLNDNISEYFFFEENGKWIEELK